MTCTPADCAAHEFVTDSFKRVEVLAEKLTEGQAKLQVCIAKLNEQMEGLRRDYERIEALEKRQMASEKFMYKVSGALALAVGIIPIALKFV